MKRLEERLAKFGIRPGLERIEKICEALGRPEVNMKVVLVTGTNGKGSVTACLSSMLSQAGFRTGAYFSPHIIRYNERFRVDGKEISDEEFAPYEDELLKLHDSGYEMTLFEALTAIAYKYFADRGCEFAVMEIGMGGRFDATNIAKEKAEIITEVDLDHMDYLGTIVAMIARDKSFIIKNPEGAVITGCTGEALEEVRKRASEIGARLLVNGSDFHFALHEARMDGCMFDFFSEKKKLERLFVPLAGKHQAFNASLAIACALELGLDEDAIRRGLEKARHIGRLQMIGKDPLVIVDGAHNPDGIRTLVQSLDIYPRGKLVCVFSALEDKDWKSMLAVLAPLCDALIINRIKNERAEDPDAIAEEARKYTDAAVVADIRKSVKAAKKKAGKKGMVLVCGSLYMIGEAMTGERKQ